MNIPVSNSIAWAILSGPTAGSFNKSIKVRIAFIKVPTALTIPIKPKPNVITLIPPPDNTLNNLNTTTNVNNVAITGAINFARAIIISPKSLVPPVILSNAKLNNAAPTINVIINAVIELNAPVKPTKAHSASLDTPTMIIISNNIIATAAPNANNNILAFSRFPVGINVKATAIPVNIPNTIANLNKAFVNSFKANASKYFQTCFKVLAALCNTCKIPPEPIILVNVFINLNNPIDVNVLAISWINARAPLTSPSRTAAPRSLNIFATPTIKVDNTGLITFIYNQATILNALYIIDLNVSNAPPIALESTASSKPNIAAIVLPIRLIILSSIVPSISKKLLIPLPSLNWLKISTNDSPEKNASFILVPNVLKWSAKAIKGFPLPVNNFLSCPYKFFTKPIAIFIAGAKNDIILLIIPPIISKMAWNTSFKSPPT